MPPELRKAHQANDRAVMQAYGMPIKETDEAACVAWLMRLYQEKVNESKTGPLGLGGRHSVLATFAKVGPQRASGVRIVAWRPCCCFEPRRASVEL